MQSHELMRLLVPDGSVKGVAVFTGLSESILYQERRESGTGLHHTGTRNTIDRLDLFCEWNLSRRPDLVRMVGERYVRMHRNHTNPVDGEVTVHDLMAQLGQAARECGEAVAACSGKKSLTHCTVEVDQAKAALERCLAFITVLEEQNS